jgi:release factor family 2
VGWGPLPDLSGWVRHRDSVVEFVLAVVDHEGGDVAAYDSDVPDPHEQSTVGGETLHVHHVPVGGWSALRYHHVTENVWAQNAKAVADQVMHHGQVDTLLLDLDAAAEVQLDPADHPGLAFGVVVDGPVRADLGLVAAAVTTGADVRVVPEAALRGEPAGALLRWEQSANGTG